MPPLTDNTLQVNLHRISHFNRVNYGKTPASFARGSLSQGRRKTSAEFWALLHGPVYLVWPYHSTPYLSQKCSSQQERGTRLGPSKKATPRWYGNAGIALYESLAGSKQPKAMHQCWLKDSLMPRDGDWMLQRFSFTIWGTWRDHFSPRFCDVHKATAQG